MSHELDIIAETAGDYWDSVCRQESPSISDFAARVPPSRRREFYDYANFLASQHPGFEGLSFRDYDVHQELGRGASAIVYAATQRTVKRRIAIKLLHPTHSLNEQAVKRFYRESEAVGRVAHHHSIVQVYAAGTNGAGHYIAMELVEGGTTLYDDRPGGDPDLRRVVQQLADVARALHCAHEVGVIHRDVKPTNILVDANGLAKITDFGLAKLLDGQASATDNGVGTPYYMAPEQIDKRVGAVSPATDVWGLGATLYEAVTGRHPFEGETRELVQQAIRECNPTDPRKHSTMVCADLAAIILRCLEHSPTQRYQSALTLAEDLDAWELGRPVSVRVPGILRRGFSFVRRNRVGVTVAATVLVAGSLVLGSRGRELEAEERVDHSIALIGRSTDLREEFFHPDEVLQEIHAIRRGAADVFSDRPVQQARVLDECAESAYRRGHFDLRVEILQEAVALDGEDRTRVGALARALLDVELGEESLAMLRDHSPDEHNGLVLRSMLLMRDAQAVGEWERENGSAQLFLERELQATEANHEERGIEVAAARLALGRYHLVAANARDAMPFVEDAIFAPLREVPLPPDHGLHLQRAKYVRALLAVELKEAYHAWRTFEIVHEARRVRWGVSDDRTVRALLDLGRSQRNARMPTHTRTLRLVIEKTSNPVLIEEAKRVLALRPLSNVPGSDDAQTAARARKELMDAR